MTIFILFHTLLERACVRECARLCQCFYIRVHLNDGKFKCIMTKTGTRLKYFTRVGILVVEVFTLLRSSFEICLWISSVFFF